MIGIGCRLEILHVTIYTFNTDGFKLKQGGRWMTIQTIGHGHVGPAGENGFAGEVRNIIDNPGFGV